MTECPVQVLIGHPTPSPRCSGDPLLGKGIARTPGPQLPLRKLQASPGPNHSAFSGLLLGAHVGLRARPRSSLGLRAWSSVQSRGPGRWAIRHPSLEGPRFHGWRVLLQAGKEQGQRWAKWGEGGGSLTEPNQQTGPQLGPRPRSQGRERVGDPLPGQ